uniref:Endo/exonuclease/phosphatase domain-containing protein n=1 Tax=Pristionchus pacificus TaxID=54126 RepID=A0A8R1Z1Y0_PRIPA
FRLDNPIDCDWPEISSGLDVIRRARARKQGDRWNMKWKALSSYPLPFSIAMIWPPDEFVSAGATFEHLFWRWIGDFSVNVVEYQLRKILINRVCVLCLPGIFAVYIILNVPPTALSTYVATACLASMIVGIAYAFFTISTNFAQMRQMKELALYGDIDRLMHEITTEYLEFANFAVSFAHSSKLVVGNHWLIHITRFDFTIVNLTDVTFEVIKTATVHSLLISRRERFPPSSLSLSPSRLWVRRLRCPQDRLWQALSHPVTPPKSLPCWNPFTRRLMQCPNCNTLRQELVDLKRSLDKTTDKQPLSLPAPTQDTYSVVKRALNDASTYAEKAKRAVWVGREELSTPDQTTSADQKAIESLCEELNDPHISDALKNGQIQHHRHPHEKGDRKRRILKIAFTDEKTRDKFLSLCRSSRPDTITKTPGNFVRRDLCPYELDLERKARIDAYTMNCKLGALVYGIRDEKLIKFNGSNPRPLPSDYANRPPRGFNNTSLNANVNVNTSLLFDTVNQSNDSSILGSISPMQVKPNATSTSTANGYNLILLTETWLTNDDSDAYLMGSADDYVVFRKDRTVTPDKSRGGGVAILVSPLLHPILIDTFSSDGIETLVIDIHPSIPIRSTRICLVYRSPSCSSPSLQSFLSFIEPLIGNLPFLICGDLNFPNIDWTSLTSPTQNDFLSFASDNRMTQFVNFKTRGENTLDLILCNKDIVRNVAPTIPFADHSSITFSLGHASPPSREFVPSRQYHLADWESINNCMSAHDWTLALSSLDADNAFSYFSEFANSVLDTFVPKTTSAPFSRYPKHLRILYGKSQRASIAAPNSVRTIHLVKRFERSLREHSVRIETSVVDSKNPKAFYALCKSRLKSCNSAPPGTVDIDGTHLLSNTDKAHAFSRAKVNLMFKCFFSSDPNLYSRAYTTFIRPLLEYGSVIWSPHTVTLANQIEAVQRNFSLRLFTRCRIPYSLYPDRINQLSLQTLEHRRFIFDLLFLHKSVHGFYSYDHSNLFKLSPLTRSLRRAHSLRIALPFVPPTSHSSFVTRVIDQWNHLNNERSNDELQFLVIEAQIRHKNIKSFRFRVRTEQFRDLQEKVNAPIGMARNVILHQSLNERFVTAFINCIDKNPRVVYSRIGELEPCFGCSSELPNVKLEKRCREVIEGSPACRQCFCRPMWCVGCLGRIFAAKQNQARPERWLDGQASCPTCRAEFCMLDVSFIVADESELRSSPGQDDINPINFDLPMDQNFSED